MTKENSLFPMTTTLVPGAPLSQSGTPEGYLQITLNQEGKIVVRGTRILMDWLLCQLAKEGWQIEFDNIRWCG